MKVGIYKIKDGSVSVETTDFNSKFVISNADDSNCKTPSKDPLSIPHSSSFLDLDGDCMPDLFLTKENGVTPGLYYELYIQKIVDEKQMYCLVEKDQIASSKHKHFPMISFGDIDRNAMIDMIYYRDGQIFTFYNKI